MALSSAIVEAFRSVASMPVRMGLRVSRVSHVSARVGARVSGRRFRRAVVSMVSGLRW